MLQYVVEHGGESVRAMIVIRLKGLMVMLSCQKYGSNVMEKRLTIGSIHDRLIIAADIIGASEDQILVSTHYYVRRRSHTHTNTPHTHT
jgi:pumilio RNA-binding family